MKADTTRNALTVLQRYRFLFNLPRSIERNIKNVRKFAKDKINNFSIFSLNMKLLLMITRERNHFLPVQRSKFLLKVSDWLVPTFNVCGRILIVLKEVESMVSKFRSDLLKQLLTNPTTFENQKKLIK